MEAKQFVSTMIVMRNESQYIVECLKSLLEQDYPSDQYEILIIDGLSEDNSVALAHETINKFNVRGVNVIFFKNPKKILASGWNIGIQNSKGNYIVRLDAHAVANSDFITENVKTILSVHDAICVGGTIKTKSIDDKSSVISEVLSCPFGVGNSKGRYSKVAGYVDTVAYGLYKKEAFEKYGLFDEKLVRTQDEDFHRKLRAAGEKFYLSDTIHSTYYSRDSIKKMMRQGYQNGKWTMINMRRRPGKMPLRHFIPFVFLTAITSLLLAGIFLDFAHLLFTLIIILYFGMGLYFACKRTQSISHRLTMLSLFFLLHITYGAGTYSGIFFNLKTL